MKHITDRDLGLISVVAEEYEKHRLPRLCNIYAKVLDGATLAEEEFDYLYRTVNYANLEMPVTHGHPELDEFYQHLYHLYRDICEMALNAEQGLAAD